MSGRDDPGDDPGEDTGGDNSDARRLALAHLLVVFGVALAGCSVLLGLAAWLGLDQLAPWVRVVLAASVLTAALLVLRGRRG